MRPDAVEPLQHDDESWLRQWRARAWRRWRLDVVSEALVWAAAAGLCTFGLTASWMAALGVAVGVWAARASWSATARDVAQMLQHVEHANPRVGNALLTWQEADTGRLAVAPMFRRRLATQARAGVETQAQPSARSRGAWQSATAVLVAAAGATGWLVMAGPASPGSRVPSVPDSPLAPGGALAPAAVDVLLEVEPPGYLGGPATALFNPEYVEVVGGSGLVAVYSGLPMTATVRMGEHNQLLTRLDTGEQTVRTRATTSGLLMAIGPDGMPARSVAIDVVPDRTPVVRIDQPGRDLRLADGTSTVVLDIAATDDFGLRTLRLLYTRVSGSGETFDFVDGEAPVRVTRASPTAWQGRATLDVRALGLAPGDTLVYHAAAQDGRTGADGLGESERYLVEIPRERALGGGDFSLPDSELRYALSQRMIIQLTERLLARQSTLDVETLRTEAQGLAVQQRRVRAEFVFLMGGEVVDEVEEAEHSHEVEAGRLDNSGQNELLDAVRQMSLAEQRLTDADLEGALVFEHRALSALQAAFGKRRYFMRTLPVRVAIDPDRRLSGDLERTTPAAWARAPLSPSAAAEARATLADVRALTPVSDGGAVAEVIAKLLALDTATRAWMPLAQQLASAFEPTAAPDMRQAAINAVASALNTRLVGAAPARMPVLLPRGREETGVATPGHSPP